jgi:hypothetical protein
MIWSGTTTTRVISFDDDHNDGVYIPESAYNSLVGLNNSL